jgi:hypothetical protein
MKEKELTKNRIGAGILLLILLLSIGCTKSVNMSPGGSSQALSVVSDQKNSTQFRPDRMLAWKANLELEVNDVVGSMSKAIVIAEQNGGYLESKSENSEQYAYVRVRIPNKNLKNAVDSFEELGTATSKRISSEDVTEKYIDIEARLKNKIALRDRLRQLLDKATEVKDILAIEAELNKVQSDIDAMEGKIKLLKGQVDFATVDLNMKKNQILGPLGFVFKGLWWGVKKLFVLSD